MMYPLVLSSLIALGVIMAKAYTLWVAHASTKLILSERIIPMAVRDWLNNHPAAITILAVLLLVALLAWFT